MSAIDDWTPALVRKYPEKAYGYMVAMSTHLRFTLADIDEKSAALSEFANALTLHKDKIADLTTELQAAQATIAGIRTEWGTLPELADITPDETVREAFLLMYRSLEPFLSRADTSALAQ